MKNRITALDQVQEYFDYYIILGGTWEQLRNQVMTEIGRMLEEWEANKENATWVLKNYIPWMKTLYEALESIDAGVSEEQLEQEQPEQQDSEVTVESLNEDRAIYLSNLDENERDLAMPFDYIEDYMDAVEQPPKRVVQQFLEQFYTPRTVRRWIETFVWDCDARDTGPGGPV